jgi:hypothetical protein
MTLYGAKVIHVSDEAQHDHWQGGQGPSRWADTTSLTLATPLAELEWPHSLTILLADL